MINLDKVRKELEDIRMFDNLFVADEYCRDPSDLIDYIVRQCRKQELLKLLKPR